MPAGFPGCPKGVCCLFLACSVSSPGYYASSVEDFYKTTNEHFSFSIEVPADWYENCPPINGDGLGISSPDGLASISFYGFNNVMEGSNARGLQTLEEYMDGRGQPIIVDGHLGREVVGPNPYAASASGEDDERYKGRWIVLLGLESGRGIVLIAPPPLFDRYNALLEEMLRTYSAEDLDRGG